MNRQQKEELVWAGLSAVAVLGASMVARKSTTAAWRYLRDEEPPEDAAHPDNTWHTVLLWGAISGLCVAGARLAGRGLLSKAWQKRLGRTPPGH